MTRYDGSSEVKGGYYLNTRTLEIVTIRGDRGRLPGSRADRYVRVPVAALLVLVPVMGGLFVIALPFLGFAVPLHAASKKLVEVSGRALRELGATLAPSWVPGEAYLADKPKEKSDAAQKDGKAAPGEAQTSPGDAQKPPDGLEQIGKEIEARREQKK
jgi:hypothetical protein